MIPDLGERRQQLQEEIDQARQLLKQNIVSIDKPFAADHLIQQALSNIGISSLIDGIQLLKTFTGHNSVYQKVLGFISLITIVKRLKN